MATEPADGSELAVTLPQPLDEWLDERAAALDVDREEVLVQLVSAYRAAADLDDDALSGFDSEGELDEDIIEAVESRLESPEATEEVEELDERLQRLESELDESLEDIRNRLLQVRDAVKQRAPKDHSHREVVKLTERVDGLAADLEDVGTEVTETNEALEDIDERLSEVESKLDRLARVVVALRKQGAGDEQSEREAFLESLRRQANRQGIETAECAACGKVVRISLLTEPACPHCGTEARNVEPPSSRLGRALDISNAKLTGVEPPALEGDDE